MTLKGAGKKNIHTKKLGTSDSIYKLLTADKTVGDTFLPDSKVDTLYTALNTSNKTNAVLIKGSDVNDTISNSGSKVTIQAQDGNDLITNTGANVLIDGGYGNDKISSNGSQVTIDGGIGNDSIVRSAGNDSLVGNTGNDKISGGAGADKIYDNTGNDSLWGDSGADRFVYANGDGQDIIYGFEKTDLLQITGTFSASYSKAKKEIYFDVGTTTNAITLKDFGSTASFNVNGTNYKISGSKLVKK